MSGRLDGRALAQAADDNLVTHFTWVQARTEGMAAAVSPELALTSCGWPCDTFNAVCRARLDRGAAGSRVRDAVGWFARDGLPFSWWLGPADQPTDLALILADVGLVPAEAEQAMAVDLGGVAPVEQPAGLSIRRVASRAELELFARLSAANWSPPDEHVIRFYAAAAPVVLAADSALRYWLGWLDGEPVATAESTVADGVVGLYSIATVPAARRQGIGTAMTVAPLLEAKAEGCSIGILQAAPDGVSVYRRIGFHSFGEIHEFKPTTAES